MTEQAMTLTEAATARIKDILAEHGASKIGVRIGVRNAGCSGTAYTTEFAESSNAEDTVVELFQTLDRTPVGAGGSGICFAGNVQLSQFQLG